MQMVAILAGLVILFVVLLDTFETIILPRTVTRRARLTRLFYSSAWIVWAAAAKRVSPGRREAFLGAFGPLSLIVLLGVWAICLVFSFALIQWGLGSQVAAPESRPGFWTDVYMSGITFFTVGFGDVTPRTALARFVSVAEAGGGLGFLAIVIGYLPVLYQSFSRREVGISLLDARAGSPPTAAELLRRHGEARSMESLGTLLHDWERWAADLLESHLSYPVLAYYRSQHDRESWLAALTAMPDACALLSLGFQSAPAWQGPLLWQAQLTFAMCRHAIVDLALIFDTPPLPPVPDRLPPETWRRLCAALDSVGISLRDGREAEERLAMLRAQYEPFVNALAERLRLTLPPWIEEYEALDNWQTSAWEHSDHFFHAH